MHESIKIGIGGACYVGTLALFSIFIFQLLYFDLSHYQLMIKILISFTAIGFIIGMLVYIIKLMGK